MASAETILGFQKVNICQSSAGNFLLFGPDESYKKDKKNRKYGFCQYDHRIWLSNTFKEENVNRIWEFLKKLKLCFWCLGSNHLSKSRRNSRICLIDRCTNTCNCLLHKKKPENIEEQNLQQSHKKHERESLENSHTSAVLKESWPNNKIYRLFLLS